MTIAPKIVRIIAIRDTRQYEEQGDRWVPIPGSGTERECDRCGRMHEIHVDVELDNRATAVIGQGCARGESMDVQSRIKSGISAALTRARLAAAFRRTAQRLAAAREVRSMVADMIPPPITLLDTMPDQYRPGSEIRVYGCGDAHQWIRPGDCRTDREIKEMLQRSWRSNRARELGHEYVHMHAEAARDLQRRIAKIDRKIAAMTAART